MTTVLLLILLGLTGVAGLGTVAWAASEWRLSRLRARRFAERVDLVQPGSRDYEREWFQECLMQLQAAVERDAALAAAAASSASASSSPASASAKDGGQHHRISAEAAVTLPGPRGAQVLEHRGDPVEGDTGGRTAPDDDGDFDRLPRDGMACDVCHANVNTHGRPPRQGSARPVRGDACCRTLGERRYSDESGL
ncbi:hypothetical protein [Streptacidiphilus rugosus]|uniref:hypothetical protein n=1 Tax=Streptacidiphilus rugosus TaxID=405783 RepID=UPI00055CA116|nr:hypothetical protein [Streptacidiphilus rugosus]